MLNLNLDKTISSLQDIDKLLKIQLNNFGVYRIDKLKCQQYGEYFRAVSIDHALQRSYDALHDAWQEIIELYDKGEK